MSKIICVTLLPVFLVFIWCANTVSSSKWHVKDGLRTCRCKVHSERELCRKPLFPKIRVEKKRLNKCLCRKYCTHIFNAKLNLEKKLDLETCCPFVWSNPI